MLKRRIGDGDIVAMLIEGHAVLKSLTEVLKVPGDQTVAEMKAIFDEFRLQFLVQNKAKAKTLHRQFKGEEFLLEHGIEEKLENDLAQQMIAEIVYTDQEDLWLARVRVLAEFVENHVEEEEVRLLPILLASSSEFERRRMGREFKRQAELQTESMEYNEVLQAATMSRDFLTLQ